MKNRSRLAASVPGSALRSAALALVLFGCGGAPSPGAQSAKSDAPEGATQAEGAFDFEATYKREASGLSERPVQGTQAAWSAKVPASAVPTLSRSENIDVIDIPIGTKAAVRCQVFYEALDAAGTLYGVIRDSAGKVEYKSIVPSGVSLNGGIPSTFLETVYFFDVSGGKGAGGLKMAVQVREQESLLCLHDELGYRRTFKDISTAFFSSFKPKDAQPKVTTYTEMSKAKLGDIDVGFTWARIAPGEKPGEREYTVSNTTLIPTSPKDVIFEDSYEVYAYDAKNVLQTGTWVEGNGGEVTLKIGLKREGEGKYSYQGELKGKPIKGLLKAPNGIATSLDIAARLKKKLKAGAPFELKLSEYHPSIDPAAVIDVTYRHQKGDPARQVVVTMNDRAMTAEVDDEGMAKSAWFQVGKQRLVIERLKSEGHL